MRIADGRTSFYQWDHDQMLTVPEDCTEVHFDNGTQPNALCCAVKEDGMVDVPNILLQTAAQIHAYGWNKERKCVVRYVCLWVEPREKPEDYVYTQTDVLRIETEIANQLQALKDSGELTGPKGDPGDAPVRGIDYWTDADKQEIINEAKQGAISDIETALDTIIAIQEELINNGGSSDGYYCDNCGELMDDPYWCKHCGTSFSECEYCGTRYNSDGPPPCDCE